jgi:hypothetical protein
VLAGDNLLAGVSEVCEGLVLHHDCGLCERYVGCVEGISE